VQAAVVKLFAFSDFLDFKCYETETVLLNQHLNQCACSVFSCSQSLQLHFRY